VIQRQEQQPEQRGFARARRAGQELEGIRLDPEGQVPQDFLPHPVSQADILESDHAALRFLSASSVNILVIPGPVRQLRRFTAGSVGRPGMTGQDADHGKHSPVWFPIR
jgi:hypothetical protein